MSLADIRSAARLDLVAAGPHVKAGHASSVAFTHSSTLKSVEEKGFFP
jgi:hypothetical protein